MDRRGFTLIELLVVIAIIALLLSILMPALTKVKEQARSVVCRSNLHQWFLCLNLYTSDNEGTIWAGWGGGEVDSKWWMSAMRTYTSDINEVRCCPSATQPGYDMGGNATSARGPFAAWGYNPNLFRQFDPAGEDDYGSYAVNGWLESPSDAAIQNRPQGQSVARNYWRKTTKITRGGTVPFMTDALWIDCWPEPDDTPPPSEDFDDWPDENHFWRIVQNRHGNGIQNAIFMDGVARKVGLKELWTFKWFPDYDTRNDYTLAGGSTGTWTPWMADFTDY